MLVKGDIKCIVKKTAIIMIESHVKIWPKSIAVMTVIKTLQSKPLLLCKMPQPSSSQYVSVIRLMQTVNVLLRLCKIDRRGIGRTDTYNTAVSS